MVFEGLEWADQGLLDFIDGMLDWPPRPPVKAISVFGGSFPREAAVALAGLGGGDRLDEALRGLTRKRVLVDR